MQKILTIFLLLTLFFLPSFGQEASISEQEEEEETRPIKYPMFVGLNFQTLIPTSTFGEEMNQAGFGGQLEFLINLNQSPFYVGFASSIANFGNEVFDFQDAEGFNLKWKTNSSLWSSHLMVHYEPRIASKIQPYVRGQIGVNHFFTVSRLVDPNVEEDRTLERYVDDNSTGLSFGGTLGLLIPLDKEWLYMLDLKATYLKGSNSTYYTKESNVTVIEDTIEAFTLKESTIDILGLQVGILFFIR